MNFRRLLFLLSVVLAVVVIFNEKDVSAHSGCEEAIPGTLCYISTLIHFPFSDETTDDLQPDILLEIITLEAEVDQGELRMTISECDSPSSDGFKVSDPGADFVLEGQGSTGLANHMIVRLDEVGCTLPPLTVIEVSVKIIGRNATGGLIETGHTWRFKTPNVSSGPSPQPPPSNPTPTPEITSVIKPDGPSATKTHVNGTGFVSTGSYQSYILFDAQETPFTSNLSSSTLEFFVPSNAECGDHTVQVSNPRSGQIPKYSNVYVLEVPCEDDGLSPPSNGGTAFAIQSFEPSNEGRSGDIVEIRGSGFDQNSLIYFESRGDLKTEYVSSRQLKFEVPPNLDCGTYDVWVENLRESTNQLEFEVRSCSGGTEPPDDDPPGEDPPPGGGINPPPTPPIGSDDLEDYDTDGDCTLSDIEFFVLLDAWLAEDIDDITFFAGVDAWIGELNICSAVASSNLVSLRVGAHGLHISASDSAGLGAVKVYDTSGKLIFSQNTQSNGLVWNLRDVMNHPVANGVYIVSVNQEVKLIIIMR